jgi:hypothetical protein
LSAPTSNLTPNLSYTSVRMNCLPLLRSMDLTLDRHSSRLISLAVLSALLFLLR